MENWHHRILCEKLEATANSDSGRLFITMPPRHSKTEIASKAFPAWLIGKNPSSQIIVATYAASLAENISRSVQGTIESYEYSRIFPNIALSKRHSSVGSWSVNDQSIDNLVAVGVGGPITGKGGDVVILDDPIKNRMEAESELIRNNTWEWYRSTLRTRLNPGASIIFVMTRWHEDDIAGRMISLMKSDPEADQWEVLELPAEAEEDSEYRRKGEALFPARYPLKALKKTRATIGEREYMALYQCKPSPPEGARFKRGWFKIVHSAPKSDIISVRYWDWAVTPEDGDWTVGSKVLRNKEFQHFLADVTRAQVSWADAEKLILQTAEIDGKDTWIGIEEVGKDAAFLKNIKFKLMHNGFKVMTMRTKQDKKTRANLWEPMAQAGMIHLLSAEWNFPWLSETCSFPLCKHDDQVDSMSGAIEMHRALSFDETGKNVVQKAKREDAHRMDEEKDGELERDPRGILTTF